MKQECPLFFVWLTWIGGPGVALLVGYRQGWLMAALVLVIGVWALIAYVRWFPRLSRLLGYGPVQDVKPEAPASPHALPKVTLYTANVCPFCPIIRERLQTLQRQLRFELEECDVTFHPGLVRAKGFRSVPIVEAAGRYLVGNATSRELVAFLNGG